MKEFLGEFFLFSVARQLISLKTGIFDI